MRLRGQVLFRLWGSHFAKSSSLNDIHWYILNNIYDHSSDAAFQTAANFCTIGATTSMDGS